MTLLTGPRDMAAIFSVREFPEVLPVQKTFTLLPSNEPVEVRLFYIDEEGVERKIIQDQTIVTQAGYNINEISKIFCFVSVNFQCVFDFIFIFFLFLHDYITQQTIV